MNYVTELSEKQEAAFKAMGFVQWDGKWTMRIGWWHYYLIERPYHNTVFFQIEKRDMRACTSEIIPLGHFITEL